MTYLNLFITNFNLGLILKGYKSREARISMKYQYIICTLMLLPLGLNLHASCSGDQVIDHRKPVFYDEQNNRHMMRNQGESGWCYAYAASDLATYHLAKNNPSALQSQNGRAVPRGSQLISPVSALANFKEYEENETFSSRTDSGKINEIINQFNNPKSRICLENEVNSSNISAASERESLSISIAMNNLEDLFKQLNPSTPDQAMVCDAWNDKFSQVFPGLNFDDFQNIVGEVKSEGRTGHDLINELINNSCKTPVAIAPLPPLKQVKKSVNPAAYLQEINHQLESGNIVGLLYNSDYLYPEKPKKADEDNPEKPKEGDEDNQHWSSIVGRRCVNGNNQFLIRNSFGSDCETYRIKENCDAGNYWVSEETLLEMSTFINYL